ncbi:replication-relaxation family protein [Streptomyces sp. HPF1205]|uniref:replication-relaxation family protein n=1 Tax=Streptomyces sp. HPF1205 TaxID=2873262 RepID=UPI001CEC9058|nr:replication-relaxation family protein [Streptomyces sp. HPF1205]
MSHTQEQEQVQEREQTGTPKRRRVLYPYGSSSPERDDAITVLGALRVATATQIMRLTRPHLSDNKSIRNALLDLAKHGPVVSEGNTAGPRGRIGTPGRAGPAAQKLWRLTAAGLDYADKNMVDGVDGGLARGVARGGAKHAMAVNETVIAFVRGGSLPDAAGGICGVQAFRTETHLPIASGSKAAVRVDAVLRAPAAGVPVLMIEVDRGTESPERVAEKLARYDQYFARTLYEVKRSNAMGGNTGTGLHWQTLFPPTGRPGTPPVAIVFTGMSRPALANRINRVLELTSEHWQFSFQDYQAGEGGVPLLVTALDDLLAHGPAGPVWYRAGAGMPRRGLVQALDGTLD